MQYDSERKLENLRSKVMTEIYFYNEKMRLQSNKEQIEKFEERE